jgi:hypothetical protein
MPLLSSIFCTIKRMPSKKLNRFQARDHIVDDDALGDNTPYDREIAERTSLLSDRDQRNQYKPADKSQSSIQQAFTATVALSALLMMADVCNLVTIAPRMAIFENIICSQYYAGFQDIAVVVDCKIEPVQGELARINGWKKTFHVIPGMAMAIIPFLVYFFVAHSC